MIIKKINVMNYIKKIIPVFLIVIGLLSCAEEKPWSEDFDIDYPVSSISSVSPMAQTIGGEVTISGANLEHVLVVRIGNSECTITSQSAGSITFTVSDFAQTNYVSVENLYMREFVYEEAIFKVQ